MPSQQPNGLSITERAEKALGTCDYKMGKGGFSAIAELPGEVWQDKAKKRQRTSCDCSGFVAWCISRSRRPQPDFGKWWLSTDTIWSDAVGTLRKIKTTERRLFKKVELADMQPGDIVVYPDKWGVGGKKLGEGHCAIVVDPATRTVIDCSSSRNGILKRTGTVFFDMAQPGQPLKTNRRQVICRYNPAGWP